MSEQPMTRVQARRMLAAAAGLGAALDPEMSRTEVSNAKLLLLAGTVKPLAPGTAVAIGVLLQHYEALVQAVRWLSEARERGNAVDFWRNIAVAEGMVRDGSGQ